jgi:hypothetical protein
MIKCEYTIEALIIRYACQLEDICPGYRLAVCLDSRFVRPGSFKNNQAFIRVFDPHERMEADKAGFVPWISGFHRLISVIAIAKECTEFVGYLRSG